MELSAIKSALEQLAPRLCEGGRDIANLSRLTGGASQETWKFDVVGDAAIPFILRRSPFEGAHNSQAIGQKVEAKLMVLAREHHVQIPHVRYVCGANDGLGEAFIMDFVAGETVARKILRDDQYKCARDLLANQSGAALARIHQLLVTPLQKDLPTSNGLDQLAQYETIYRGFHVNRPVIELAISWLKATAPKPVEPCLVHGDFRNGNLIVGPEGLRAVLDWELAHIGDPREDLGWICVNSWRFGVSRKLVGGFGDLGDFLTAYEAGGGAHYEACDIKWFQALGSLKWGIMCLMMYHAFQTGADKSVERAMIGRRTSEAEFDLLNLMENMPYA